MEARLVPVNALIALMTGDNRWPTPLAEQGFAVTRLELPIKTARGSVTIDLLATSQARRAAILAEAKSGGSIGPEQAQKYGAATVTDVRRQITLFSDRSADDTVEPLVVCPAAYEPAIRTGLEAAEMDCALLTVDQHERRCSLTVPPASRLTPFRVDVPAGPPPAFVEADHESSDEDLRRLLLAEALAAIRRNEQEVPVAALLHRIRGVPQLGRKAFGVAARRATTVLVSIAESELSDAMSVRQGRDDSGQPGGILRVERTPVDLDNRGETQAWQKYTRRTTGGRRLRRELEGQLTFDQLGEEAEKGD